MKFKDVDLIELIGMMESHDVAEIVLKDGKTVIEVKRQKEPFIVDRENIIAQSTVTAEQTGLKQAGTGGEAQGENEGETNTPTSKQKNDNNYHVVEAPLVGTFYRSPAPEEDAFVEVGDRVDSGDVLCIVEAMKSMNEIQSDVSGVIKEICVDNAELVEFEQPLFKIETNV